MLSVFFSRIFVRETVPLHFGFFKVLYVLGFFSWEFLAF